jgi:MCM P-loop domain
MIRVSFSDVLNSKYYGKPIAVKCIVSGKSLSPYTVPKRLKVKCPDDECEHKKYCKVKGETIEISAVDSIKFVDLKDNQFKSMIGHMYKLSCDFSYEALEMQNVERLFISASTGKERITNISTHEAFFVGYGLEVNTVYEMEGIPAKDPRNQQSTVVFTKAKKLKSDADTFFLTPKTKTGLEEFHVEKPTVEKVFCHLEDVYEYYARNITKIYNRFILHLAVDLVFRSPLAFKFDNETLDKGWLDIMIIGDTRCGKSYVVERLMKYFNVGEIVSGDITSIAGLVGGAVQYNGHWVTSWGKIPMNDKSIVGIDEAHKIKPEEWEHLTRIRGAGVAEIHKIVKQMTNARTRLISLANPPLKNVANYGYGIQSLKDVVKSPESIARFDYVLVVSHSEVSDEDINKSRKEMTVMYDPDLEQELVMWAWSRKISQIHFTDGAIELVYKFSKELGRMFSFVIPLIQGENVRLKLSKIAICFAARIFSNKEEGKILLVEKVHVECARAFLMMIYKQESSGYYVLSQIEKDMDVKIDAEEISKIDKYLETFTNSKLRLCKCLLNGNFVTANDLLEQVNLPKKEIAFEVISKLIDLNLIKKHPHGVGNYVKTPAFSTYLKNTVSKSIRGNHE